MNETYLAYAVLCAACVVNFACFFINPHRIRNAWLGFAVFFIRVMWIALVVMFCFVAISWALSVALSVVIK